MAPGVEWAFEISIRKFLAANEWNTHDSSVRVSFDAATDDPSQFYSGLIADLYEPLAGELASADVYIPFLDQSGSPALELGCGSGVPLLDLVERGYDVDGLDASQDMLDRCHAAAGERGLDISIHLATVDEHKVDSEHGRMGEGFRDGWYRG